MTRAGLATAHVPNMNAWSVRKAMGSRVAVSLLAAGLVLRLLYGAWASLPYLDGGSYDQLAHNLLTHGEYRLADDHGYPRRAPGYPFFLAAVYGIAGERHTVVRTAQAAVDIGTGVLVLAIARQLQLPRNVGILAMGIAMFNPFTFVYSAMILSETLATFLVTLGTWLLLTAIRTGKQWAVLGFGAVLSVAALVRPSFALLPAALLLVAVLTRQLTVRRWGFWCVLAAAAFVSVWLPWGVRNAVHLQSFVPYHRQEFSTEGYNRWAATWAVHLMDIYAAFFDKSLDLPDRAFRNEAERAEVNVLLALRDTADPQTVDGATKRAAVDERFHQLAVAYIAEHPVDFYVLKPLLRCFTMWFTSNSTFLAQANVPISQFGQAIYDRPFALFAKLLGLVFSNVFPLLALLGWWHVRGENGRAADLLVAVGVYSTLVVQAFVVLGPAFQVFPEPRYVIESFPGLTPLVAAAVMLVWARRPILARQRASAGRKQGPPVAERSGSEGHEGL